VRYDIIIDELIKGMVGHNETKCGDMDMDMGWLAKGWLNLQQL
jgi:hypothetical protein